MVGDRVVVDLGQPAFLGADAAGEIAEMVDGERDVRGHGLADRLAIVPGLGLGQQGKVLLHPVGDAIKDQRPFGRAGASPGILSGMGGIERQFDIGRVRPGDRGDDLAIDRRGVVEVAPVDRFGPGTADEIAIARLERCRARNDRFENCHLLVFLRVWRGTAPTVVIVHRQRDATWAIKEMRGRRRQVLRLSLELLSNLETAFPAVTSLIR